MLHRLAKSIICSGGYPVSRPSVDYHTDEEKWVVFEPLSFVNTLRSRNRGDEASDMERRVRGVLAEGFIHQ